MGQYGELHPDAHAVSEGSGRYNSACSSSLSTTLSANVESATKSALSENSSPSGPGRLMAIVYIPQLSLFRSFRAPHGVVAAILRLNEKTTKDHDASRPLLHPRSTGGQR